MSELKSVKIKLEITIMARVDETWNCLIQDVGLWWRKDFYSTDKTKTFVIEPKVGGRMYEDCGNGEGMSWGEVIVLDSPRMLQIKGHLSPQFGGPAINFLTLELTDVNGDTLLTLTDHTFGEVSIETERELSSGWKMLFEEGFKTYVENK